MELAFQRSWEGRPRGPSGDRSWEGREGQPHRPPGHRTCGMLAKGSGRGVLLLTGERGDWDPKQGAQENPGLGPREASPASEMEVGARRVARAGSAPGHGGWS